MRRFPSPQSRICQRHAADDSLERVTYANFACCAIRDARVNFLEKIELADWPIDVPPNSWRKSPTLRRQNCYNQFARAASDLFPRSAEEKFLKCSPKSRWTSKFVRSRRLNSTSLFMRVRRGLRDFLANVMRDGLQSAHPHHAQRLGQTQSDARDSARPPALRSGVRPRKYRPAR